MAKRWAVEEVTAMKNAARPATKTAKPTKKKLLGSAKSLGKIVNVNDLSPV
jgi:hypothetical protein